MIAKKFRKMTEEEYRAHPAVNKSTLWEMRKSPAHYKWALDHPSPDTPALKMGRAIHMGILQPDDFNSHYVLAQNWDRRTKEGREMYNTFVQQNADKEILTVDDYNDIVGMYESVWSDPAEKELLFGCEYETPLCCTDAATNRFMRDGLAYGYDVQAAHYLRGYKAQFGKNAQFYFVAVEKKPPYAVNVIHAGDDFIDRGTWQLIDLLDKLKECRKKRKWPGYGVNELVLPEWAVIPEEDE